MVGKRASVWQKFLCRFCVSPLDGAGLRVFIIVYSYSSYLIFNAEFIEKKRKVASSFTAFCRQCRRVLK